MPKTNLPSIIMVLGWVWTQDQWFWYTKIKSYGTQQVSTYDGYHNFDTNGEGSLVQYFILYIEFVESHTYKSNIDNEQGWTWVTFFSYHPSTYDENVSKLQEK